MTKPFFKKSPIDLFSANAATAQAFAQQHHYDLLSRAIPARTYSIGANAMQAGVFGFAGSVDIQSMQPAGWPPSREDDTRWWHSDCRNVAYLFTHRLFEEIVNHGELK